MPTELDKSDAFDINEQAGGSTSFKFATTLAQAIKEFQFELASESIQLQKPSFFFTVINVSNLDKVKLSQIGDYVKLKYNTK